MWHELVEVVVMARSYRQLIRDLLARNIARWRRLLPECLVVKFFWAERSLLGVVRHGMRFS